MELLFIPVVMLVSVFTFVLGAPAALLFSACFGAATWLDRQLGHRAAGSAA